MKKFTDPFHSDMVPIRGGTFEMGSEDGYSDENPVHSVTVADFHLCKYPVTQAQWRSVMGSDPEELCFAGLDDCPVERVSWHDVQDFLEMLNHLTGKQYRLPSEAEWEFAARGGITPKGFKYAGSDDPDEVAWYDRNSGGNTHPVGEKKANERGLYDMSGNVWEWCEDVYHPNYHGAPTDGSAWISDGNKASRVVRGGSWDSISDRCGSTNCDWNYAYRRSQYIGFRLAM